MILRKFSVALVLLVLAGSTATPAPKQDSDALDMMSTRGIVELYKSTKQWSLKAICLLALGKKWHPEGADMVLEALKDRNLRLKAFAIEALARTDKTALKQVMTKDLVEHLIRKHLGIKHQLYRSKVIEVLKAVMPDLKKDTTSQIKSWWGRNKKTYDIAAWDGEKNGGSGTTKRGMTVAEKFVRRAFEMSEVGLDVVICIDTTGSMQTTINAARDGLSDIIAIVRGVSARFRLGCVMYKDYEDYPKDGAKIVMPLTPAVEQVQQKLGKINADGGGDLPERVERGLEMALSDGMGWKKTTNKSIIVIGDAPPHPNAVQKAKDLVKNAKDKPFGKDEPDDVATGEAPVKKEKKTLPFITSCIAVGMQQIYPQTGSTFQEIATAGGGSYGTILTNGGKAANAEKIVRQILKLSFGKGWEKEVAAFAEIYLAYRKARFFN